MSNLLSIGIFQQVANSQGVVLDLTPDAVDWNNVSNTSWYWVDTNSQKITGITDNITLKFIITGSNLPNLNDPQLRILTEAIVSGGEGTQGPYKKLINNSEIVVAPDATIYFQGYGMSLLNISVTVINKSDGDAVLDTFTIACCDDP